MIRDSAPAEPSPSATASELLQQCCADLYSNAWARLLLGDSFHPGGLALTTRMADLLGLHQDQSVLDVAAGIGTSAIHVAGTFACQVTGIDFAGPNLAIGSESARRAGLSSRVHFGRADARHLPFGDASFDAVLCECACSSFADKAGVAAEMRRALRDRGKLGLSDMVVNGCLPDEVKGIIGVAACLADAQAEQGYASLLEAAGFSMVQIQRHDDALLDLIAGARKKLAGAQLLQGTGHLPLLPFSLADAKDLIRSFESAVEGGEIGYIMIIATAV